MAPNLILNSNIVLFKYGSGFSFANSIHFAAPSLDLQVKLKKVMIQYFLRAHRPAGGESTGNKPPGSGTMDFVKVKDSHNREGFFFMKKDKLWAL